MLHTSHQLNHTGDQALNTWAFGGCLRSKPQLHLLQLETLPGESLSFQEGRPREEMHTSVDRIRKALSRPVGV